ncbi:MAG: hypothetical protein ACLQVF_23530 [Isosphaeraceae bacterium]
MRKRVWAAVAALAILGVGGLVYAHSVRTHADLEKSNTSASTAGEPSCPLGWLLNQCHLGH